MITGIFCIKRKRKNILAFIDEDSPPDNDTIDSEYFDDNTNGTHEVGNLEDNAGQRFGHGLFSIYCRSCYSLMDRRRQNIQNFEMNCLRKNSNQDEERILNADEGEA